jgi:hypothetical protein
MTTGINPSFLFVQTNASALLSQPNVKKKWLFELPTATVYVDKDDCPLLSIGAFKP